MKSILSLSEAAIVTSGTATLETALYGVPQIVVYKGSPLSYQIAKRLIKVKYISLVNLIMDKQLVPELIQADCNAASILKNLYLILDLNSKERIRSDYRMLSELLTAGGGAEVAALDIISDLDQRKS
jgi:lipid-A-disaccharide synthase